MKTIPLTQGRFAIVDDEDFERFGSLKWYALKNGLTFYVIRSKPRSSREPRKKLHLHREILGLTEGDGIVVDHINGDGLDNRKDNLRLVSTRGNNQNTFLHRSGRLPGARLRQTGKYESRIWFNGKSLYLGVFNTAAEAHKAYKLAEQKIEI